MANIKEAPYGCTETYTVKFWYTNKDGFRQQGEENFYCNSKSVFTAKVILSNEKWYKQTLVWDKNKCGSPGLAKIRPMQVTEDIVVFAPNRTVYNPQMQVGEPYYRKSKNPEGYVPRCNTHGYGLKPVTEIKNEGTRYPKNIIRIPVDYSAQQRVHPTQKPVALAEYLIKTYSNENDTVLDNTFGSGFSGIAAVNTNRKFIGIELPESEGGYFNLGKERILNAINAKTTNGT